MIELRNPAAYRRLALDEPAALVARLRRGDEAALGTLVDALWRPLVSYATWLLDDADAASDVVQDSLSHVWMTRDHLAIKTSLEAYLYRVVHNRALDERRRTTRRRRHPFLLHANWLRAWEAAADFFERKLKNRITTAGTGLPAARGR